MVGNVGANLAMVTVPGIVPQVRVSVVASLGLALEVGLGEDGHLVVLSARHKLVGAVARCGGPVLVRLVEAVQVALVESDR